MYEWIQQNWNNSHICRELFVSINLRFPGILSSIWSNLDSFSIQISHITKYLESVFQFILHTPTANTTLTMESKLHCTCFSGVQICYQYLVCLFQWWRYCWYCYISRFKLQILQIILWLEEGRIICHESLILCQRVGSCHIVPTLHSLWKMQRDTWFKHMDKWKWY